MGKGFDNCDMVSREEAEKVLRQPVTGVVSGDGFCTWLTEGPVFVAALSEYESKDHARNKMAADRRRREKEGKTVTDVDGIGQSAQKAVSSRSLELSVLDGMRVIEMAVAGDDVDPDRYEQRIGSLMKTLISRQPLTIARPGQRL